nr:MAG TPA: hypothetical protein [Caudoviricetes sp.]DAS33605.1 MAG TPA: hypothetical protein [Caudoviricetes sp.]
MNGCVLKFVKMYIVICSKMYRIIVSVCGTVRMERM